MFVKVCENSLEIPNYKPPKDITPFSIIVMCSISYAFGNKEYLVLPLE